MEMTIKSRKLGREVTFSTPGNYHIYVDLNGQAGTLGKQICEGGELIGDTLSYNGDDQEVFEKICRRWWKNYLKNERGYMG